MYFLGAFASIVFFACSDASITNELFPLSPTKMTTRAAGEFPSVSDIRNNGTVSSAMNRLWNQTKNSANKNGRREFGFYIYYNKNTGLLSVGPDIYGPLVSGCIGTNASIYPGRPSDNTTVCAFFHTHTPLTYCTDGYRVVGPSPADQSFASSNNLPCLLYDYSSNINAGHNLNAPARIYTFGPNRRPSY